MEGMNFGPRGCWAGAAVLALIGLVSTVVLLVKGIIWIFNHVSIS